MYIQTILFCLGDQLCIYVIVYLVGGVPLLLFHSPSLSSVGCHIGEKVVFVTVEPLERQPHPVCRNI